MLPLKRIICPTDFSEPSYKALDAACELALRFSSELFLIHVVTAVPTLPSVEASPSFNIPFYLEYMDASSNRLLDELIAEKIPKQIHVSRLVVQGQPADEIVRAADDRQADLIVIATHGRTGWRRFVFGSVAEKVVRLSTCPVLTIQALPAAPSASREQELQARVAALEAKLVQKDAVIAEMSSKKTPSTEK